MDDRVHRPGGGDGTGDSLEGAHEGGGGPPRVITGIGLRAIASVAVALMIVAAASVTAAPRPDDPSTASVAVGTGASDASASDPSSEPSSTAGPARSPTPSAAPARGSESPSDPTHSAWFQVGSHPDVTHSLYVGRLDGPAIEVVTRDAAILGSGPVDGRILAWWRQGDTTTVVVVDTTDGSQTAVMHTTDVIGYGASLDPSGRYIYLAPMADDTHIRGLFRMPVEGGEQERVADGWDAGNVVMIWSADGRWLALSDEQGSATTYRILDTRSGQMSVHRGSGIGDAFSFLGDELVGYLARDDGGELHYPLLGLDVGTDTVRTLVDGDGLFAGIFPDGGGDPVLVYDTPDAAGRYTLRRTDGTGESSLLYSSDDDWLDATMGEGDTSQLVRTNLWNGVESPGWVPVFSAGAAYTWPNGPNFGGDDRRLVSLDSEQVLTLKSTGGDR